jgi:plastocyanin
MHLSVRSFAVLMGLAVVASACGGADSGAPSTTVTEAATTTTVEVATTTTVEANTTTSEAAAAPVTVEIEAFDYGFSGFDTELKVGDTLELFNSSASEYHSLIVIRISDAYPIKTIEEVIALDPVDIWEGGVVDSFGRHLHAAPGSKAVGRIRLQTPGTYIALDWLPQGADPEAISLRIDPATGRATSFPFGVPGGPLGYQQGMIVEFEVGDA